MTDKQPRTEGGREIDTSHMKEPVTCPICYDLVELSKTYRCEQCMQLVCSGCCDDIPICKECRDHW